MKIKEIVTLSEGKYSGPMEPLTAKGTAKNGAVAALETALIRAKKNGTTMNYENIDAMMQKICQAHNITGQKLHDDFVKAHDLIPDNWIKKQKLKEYKVETVDVDAVHAELLHQHLLSNPALYENREDFQSVREFLKLHTTPPPRVNRHYVYASVQSTPIAQYCTIAHFNKEHRLVKLDGQFAYFDIDGEIKRFPESGTLNGDALAQIYFFNSINEFEHFTTVLGLKFSHYKHATKILDKHTVDENFADGKNPGNQIREKLNAWMNQDQSMNADPTKRTGLQSHVWTYIQKNINSILSDKGADGKGSYPAAPYAAWLLVQHMDATPNNQSKFASQLEQAGLDPTNGKDGEGKLQFIKDRAAVNQSILKLNDPKKYLDKHGKPLTNPTADVRDPSKFDDAGIEYTSAAAALDGAIAAGNTLLVDAVKKAQATTQPSYKQSANENFADGRNPGRKGLAKRVGVNCKQPVSKLRSIAAHSSGERQRMAHWCANMKSGKKK